MVSINTPSSRNRFVVGLIVASVAVTFLLVLEAWFRPLAGGGIYFQKWSSEAMMQTVSIEDLRDEPLRTLWYLHIQPPVYDTIRAVLAWVWKSGDSMQMERNVDQSLYVLWALVYGFVGFVVYWWLSEKTSVRYAAVSSLLILAHPASIFYATFLETTLLSACLVLCFYYLLWRIKERRPVSGGILALSFLSLFLTRSVFQWPWLILLTVCLLLLKFPLRRLAVFVAISATIVGIYTLKQYKLFGLTTTSSFTGYNLCRSLGAAPVITEPASGIDDRSDSPKVLTRIRKSCGAENMNHMGYLQLNREWMQEYRERVRSASPLFLFRVYLDNLAIYMRPSSQYTEHVIIDRLPWRKIYDRVFSYPVYIVLMVLATGFWFWRTTPRDYLGTAGLCVPAAAIVLLCVVSDRGENMRFKFFLEPVLLVFLFSQGYMAAGLLKRNALTRPFKRQSEQAGMDCLTPDARR